MSGSGCVKVVCMDTHISKYNVTNATQKSTARNLSASTLHAITYAWFLCSDRSATLAIAALYTIAQQLEYLHIRHCPYAASSPARDTRTPSTAFWTPAELRSVALYLGVSVVLVLRFHAKSSMRFLHGSVMSICRHKTVHCSKCSKY